MAAQYAIVLKIDGNHYYQANLFGKSYLAIKYEYILHFIYQNVKFNI